MNLQLKNNESNNWIDPKVGPSNQTVQLLNQELGLSLTSSQLLVGRGFDNLEKAYDFLNPGNQLLHDPFLLKDMEKAVLRLASAIRNREKIMILGDCDTDGTAGLVILYEYIKQASGRVFYMIPERDTQGYGLNKHTVFPIIRSKTQVVVTVDNGCNAMETSKDLARENIDLIITDHHHVEGKLPPAYAIINPLRVDCDYPFKSLSGAAVAFKFVTALDQILNQINYWDVNRLPKPSLDRFLDLVALATVADRCPLRGENRSLVKLGLEKINTAQRPGLAALIKASNIHGYISPFVISHRIAPKINAAGRMNQPLVASRLLLSKSIYEGFKYADQLNYLNRQRQIAEKKSYEIALFTAKEEIENVAIVQLSDQFHPGTLSIVASRLNKFFQKPTILLSLSNGIGIGSARSDESVNLQEILKSCSELIDQYGGHTNALGLTVQSKNFQAFKASFFHCVERHHQQNSSIRLGINDLQIDAYISKKDWSSKVIRELIKMSPFGYKNPEPILGIKNIQLNTPKVLSKKHFKFDFSSNQEKMEIYAWDHYDWIDKIDQVNEIAVSPQIHMHNNEPTLQLKLLDWH